MMRVSSEKDMQDSYKLFETKGGKGITFDSLQQSLDNAEVYLSEDEIRQVISELDENGSGKINY